MRGLEIPAELIAEGMKPSFSTRYFILQNRVTEEVQFQAVPLPDAQAAIQFRKLTSLQTGIYRGVAIRPQNRGGFWLYSPAEPNPTGITMRLSRNLERAAVGRLLWTKGYFKGPITSHNDSKLKTFAIPYLTRDEYHTMIMNHLSQVKANVHGNTRFKKATLFRIYMSPIQ